MQQQNKKTFDGVNRQKFSKLEAISHENLHKKISLRYSGLKMIGVGILSIALLVSLSTVGGTVSYYADIENSVGSKLLADPLSFDVEIASSTSAQINISESGEMVVPFMFLLPGSKEVQYSVKSEFVSGDLGFCSAIKALGAFPFPYDSNLIGLQTGFSTQAGSWALTFSVPDVSLFSSATCTVGLVYKGWNADGAVGEGYSDTQKVTIIFTSPEVVPTVLFRGASEPSSDLVEPEAPLEEEVVPEPETTKVDETVPLAEPEEVVEEVVPVEVVKVEPVPQEVAPEPTL